MSRIVLELIQMKRIKSSVFLLALIIFLGLIHHCGETPSFAGGFSYHIESHHLAIRIVPSHHFIKAEDRLKIRLQRRGDQVLSFFLNSRLKIDRIVDLKTGRSLSWNETTSSPDTKRIDISLKKAGTSFSLSISYEGQIHDPVVKEKSLQFVRGDQTPGLIGLEGVYLSSSSGWYPDRPESRATFRVEAVIPEPFRIVTQGELLSEQLKSGFWRSEWSYALPTEGLTLVAGIYSVKRRKVNDIRISTYFFPEDDKFAEIFLDGAEDYLRIYSDLLGQYPFKKFDIVQNFFSSGYSFPTFTLLAPETIRQGKEFLRPGALDHEIVHSWWGHYVSVKPGTGNWVEALTTYCTNYYYKELKMGEEAARKHRQDVMQKYAIQVPPSKDYPLRQFGEKQDELDSQIGYGKGSMVFHMLREMAGKDRFFSTLRDLARRYGGKQASWEDIQKVFEESSGKRLDWFFSQWLDRPEGPQLKLENVKYQVMPKGYSISGEVVQGGEVYRLTLPVVVEAGGEKKRLFLEASQKITPFSMELERMPSSLVVDPDHQIFRRLHSEEIIPCLNALLEDPEKIFVLPGEGGEESRAIYKELATKAKERKDGKVVSVEELMKDRLQDSSLVLFGETWKDPLFSKLLSNLPGTVLLKDNGFILDGKRVDQEDESLLLTYPHPLRPGKWVTIYFGKSPRALSRASYLFFYGWDSYILFRNGRPEKRGNFPPRSSFTSYESSSREDVDQIRSQKLREHVSYLASDELKGRLPGTSEYRKAQAYIMKTLEEMGISPVIQPFSITVKDIEEARLRLDPSPRDINLRAIPLRFSKEGEWKGPILFVDGKGLEEIKDLSEKSAIAYLDTSEDLSSELLLRKIVELQSRKPSVILIFLRENGLDALSPYVTYPSYFPPGLKKGLKEKDEKGYGINRLIEASKVAAGGGEAGVAVEIPVVVVPYSQREERDIESLFDQKDAFIEFALRFKEVRLSDANIGGIISGHDPEKKGELLVLGAHYDHLGVDEKSGAYYPGADDNASGVAALLEVARSLMGRRTDLRRSALILFFGGEEWGLEGSSYFVENPFVPLARMKAMFSLDSIGRSTGKRELFFIGNSKYPELARRSRRFLDRLGLKEGANTDRDALALESDHVPFHRKGIPALAFFASDYKKLHTLQDNLESIDLEKLADVTRLIYLTAYQFLTEP